MSFVLVITGPAGSGKTTSARQVAKLVDKCVNIDVDHVKHFIVSGFIYDHSSSEGIKQWELLGDNIGLLAHNFIDAGYNVIINGFLDEISWTSLQKHVDFTNKVLLLPALDTVLQRDAGHDAEVAMGDEAVKEHHDYFSTNTFYDDFVKLDTTSHTVDETVQKIIEIAGIK